MELSLETALDCTNNYFHIVITEFISDLRHLFRRAKIATHYVRIT